MSRRPDADLLAKLREAHDPAHPFMVIAISPPLVYSKEPVEEILSILSGIAGAIDEREGQDAYDTVMMDADGHSFGMIWYDGEKDDDAQADASKAETPDAPQAEEGEAVGNGDAGTS